MMDHCLEEQKKRSSSRPSGEIVLVGLPNSPVRQVSCQSLIEIISFSLYARAMLVDLRLSTVMRGSALAGLKNPYVTRSIRDAALLFPSHNISDNDNETHSIVSYFCATSGGVTSGGVIGRLGQAFKKVAEIHPNIPLHILAYPAKFDIVLIFSGEIGRVDTR